MTAIDACRISSMVTPPAAVQVLVVASLLGNDRPCATCHRFHDGVRYALLPQPSFARRILLAMYIYMLGVQTWEFSKMFSTAMRQPQQNRSRRD